MAQLPCPTVLGIIGFPGSPVSVTSIGISAANPGLENASYRGKFTTSEGTELDFLAHQEIQSEDPNSFYSVKKNVDATFQLQGKKLPALEHIGLSTKTQNGVDKKAETYQLSLWDKNDRRYTAKAVVEYVKGETGEWQATTGNFTLTLTRLDPKQNQIVLELAGPGVAESIIKLPKKEK